MRLIKDNILIREAELTDAVTLNNWWNDGEIMADVGFPNGLNESLERTIDNIKFHKGRINKLCIIEIDNLAVGEASTHVEDDNTAYPGWKICDKNYQNKGYGSKIINMILEYIFTDSLIQGKKQIDRVIIDTLLDNKRAQYVYENKMKLRKINVKEDAWKDPLGNMRGIVEYEITKEEFLNSRNRLSYNKLIEDDGREICKWRYADEYSIYNLPDYDMMKESNLGFTNDEKRKNYYSFYDKNDLVGFINLLDDGEYVFLGIGVNPNEVSKGYGKNIIKEAIGISERLYGDKIIYLEVRTWNKRAINCYKAAGFEIVDTIVQTTSIGDGEFYKMEYKRK